MRITRYSLSNLATVLPEVPRELPGQVQVALAMLQLAAVQSVLDEPILRVVWRVAVHRHASPGGGASVLVSSTLVVSGGHGWNLRL